MRVVIVRLRELWKAKCELTTIVNFVIQLSY